MEIVELIQIINQTYNTTVIFDDPIKCANREPNNDFLIYFTPMNEVERRKYKKVKIEKWLVLLQKFIF